MNRCVLCLLFLNLCSVLSIHAATRQQQRCEQFVMLSKLRMGQGDHSFSWLQDYPLESNEGIMVFRAPNTLLFERNGSLFDESRWMLSDALKERISHQSEGQGTFVAADLNTSGKIELITCAWQEGTLSHIPTLFLCYERNDISETLPMPAGDWIGASSIETTRIEAPSSLVTEKQAQPVRLLLLPVTPNHFAGRLFGNPSLTQPLDCWYTDGKLTLIASTQTVYQLLLQTNGSTALQGTLLLPVADGWSCLKLHLKRITANSP